MKSFTVRIKPEDISKLDEILKPCVELTSLSLSLCANQRNGTVRRKLANNLSLLIGHHPSLKRLVLENFEDLLHSKICVVIVTANLLVQPNSHSYLVAS